MVYFHGPDGVKSYVAGSLTNRDIYRDHKSHCIYMSGRLHFHTDPSFQCTRHSVSPRSTDLFNLNFQSLEAVPRYRDTQLQVTENVCDL